MTVNDNENTTMKLTDEEFFKALREKPLQIVEKIDLTNALEGWVSPVELVYENAKKTYLEQVEGHIMARCEAALGVKVDRDELIKAMNYDRDQYKKGYKKGYADGFYKAVEELVITIKMPPEGKTITLPKWRKTE